MEKLDKKALLVKIEEARIMLGFDLENGLITNDDIINSLTQDNNYRLSTISGYKSKLLRDIANAPFLLCDQDSLDLNIKKLLPSILHVRFNMEMEELYALYENGDLSADELLTEKKMLKFCYYESSVDGKHILKNGHVKPVVNNIIKSR